MTHETEIIRTEDLTPGDRETIQAWTRTLFGAAEDKYEWAPPDWTLLMRSGGDLVCHLAIVEQTIRVGDRAVRVAGIGGVMTPAEWQGRGLARAAMERAAEFMRGRSRISFGLLLCSESLLRYYSRMGWRRVADPVVFDQPGGKLTWEEEAMWLPCGEDDWPDGVVDLCGPPW